MTDRTNYPGDLQKLANRILALEDQLAEIRDYGLTVPVFDSDPDDAEPTNLWLFPDGRLRLRMPDGTLREVVSRDGTTTTSAVLLPPEEPVQASYEDMFPATWTASYYGDPQGLAQRSTTPLWYGTAPGVGQQRSMLGFDTAAIVAALAGARVSGVELYWANLDAATASVTIHLGAHTSALPPATLQRTRTDVALFETGATEQDWHSIDPWVGEALRDGVISGLTVDQPDSHLLSGYAAGVGSGYAVPTLRIAYVK